MENITGGAMYHLVCYQKPKGVESIRAVWTRLKATRGGQQVGGTTKGIACYHGSIISDRLYVREGNEERVQQTAAGQYVYSAFFCELSLGRVQMLAFLFPYRRLGRDFVNDLGDKDLFRPLFAGSPDIAKVIRKVGDGAYGTETSVAEYAAEIHGVQGVDAVVLSGKNPNDSELFKRLNTDFKTKGTRCIVRYTPRSPTEGMPVRLHIDVFGNFQFYLRVDAKNLDSVLAFVGRLASDALFTFGATSPFDRTYLDTSG
jgi:hypothetical protein